MKKMLISCLVLGAAVSAAQADGFTGQAAKGSAKISRSIQASQSVFHVVFKADGTYACENMAGALGHNKLTAESLLKSPKNGECANLRGADLFKAQMNEAKLDGADLRSANLIGADMTRANLIGADLRGAELFVTKLIGAKLFGANLTKANLTAAFLTGAYLSKAELTNANLRAADLRRTDLRDSNLRGANLYEANLSEADLRGADLRESYLFKANMNGAIYDDGTKLPSPYDSNPESYGMIKGHPVVAQE